MRASSSRHQTLALVAIQRPISSIASGISQCAVYCRQIFDVKTTVYIERHAASVIMDTRYVIPASVSSRRWRLIAFGPVRLSNNPLRLVGINAGVSNLISSSNLHHFAPSK